MALCSFIHVSHFLVKTLRIALTKVFPISALSYKVWSPRTQEASDRTRARRRCLWQDAALPVPTGGRLWHSLCAVCRRGTCHWAPVPARPGRGPRCWPRVARRPSLLSAAQRPATSEVRSARLDASPRTPHLRLWCAWRGLDPVPLPAPWTGWSFPVSDLSRAPGREAGALRTPDARAAAPRPAPQARGSPTATPGYRWVHSRVSRSGALSAHSMCPASVSRCGPSSFVPHGAWGMVPVNAPGSCPGTRPQGLRFECQLKKTKAV